MECIDYKLAQVFEDLMLKMLSRLSCKLNRNLPEVKALLLPEVLQLCQMFEKKGYEIRVVGGAVRDMLMKKTPKDIDLATTATPDVMVEVFRENKVKYIETGLQHGTITAHINGKDFEVTTLRVDIETFGRQAKVAFTNDWVLDADRRDLTFNAMSVRVDGTLFDYFEGQQDLLGGHVSIGFNWLSFRMAYVLVQDDESYLFSSDPVCYLELDSNLFQVAMHWISSNQVVLYFVQLAKCLLLRVSRCKDANSVNLISVVVRDWDLVRAGAYN